MLNPYERLWLASWQRKEQYSRRSALRAPEAARVARIDGHILPPIDRIGDDPAVDRPAGIEAIKRLTIARVQYEKIASQLARKNQLGRSRRHRRQQRALRFILPAHRARRRVNRRQ